MRRTKAGSVRRLAAVVVVAMVAWGAAADALPMYAAREGKQCAFCHVNPAGGGPRNAMGRVYAANDHRFPPNAAELAAAMEPDAAHASVWDRIALSSELVLAYTLSDGAHERVGDCQSCHDSEYTPNNQIFLMVGRLAVAIRASDDFTIVASNDLGTMYEAYGRYRIAGDAVAVRGGLFVVPFGLRMRDHTAFVRSKFGVGSNRRDVGVAVEGNPGIAFYDLGITRGGTLIPTSPPVQRFGGDVPTIAATAGIRKFGATVGGSFIRGRSAFVDRYRDADETTFRISENPRGYDQIRWEAFGSYTRGPITLEGEIAGGTDEETRDDPTGTDPRREFSRRATFLAVTATPIRRVDLIARQEFFDPSTDHKGDALTNWVFIAEVDVTPQITIQGRYRIRREAAASFDNNDFIGLLRFRL